MAVNEARIMLDDLYRQRRDNKITIDPQLMQVMAILIIGSELHEIRELLAEVTAEVDD